MTSKVVLQKFIDEYHPIFAFRLRVEFKLKRIGWKKIFSKSTRIYTTISGYGGWAGHELIFMGQEGKYLLFRDPQNRLTRKNNIRIPIRCWFLYLWPSKELITIVNSFRAITPPSFDAGVQDDLQHAEKIFKNIFAQYAERK